MVLVKDKTGKYGHKGKWLLLSKNKSRVLRIFGKKKPSKEKVRKVERRIQYFKHKKKNRGAIFVRKYNRNGRPVSCYFRKRPKNSG